MKDTILLTGCLVAFVVSASFTVVLAHKNYTDMLTRVETLETRNAELLTLCKAQEGALERIRADAAAQSERLAKAQADAAKTRAKSEAKVQEILTAPAPDDGQELAAWAAKEAKVLSGGLGQ